jgi:hypothetical protein
VTKSLDPDGRGQPRGKKRPGAAIALGLWALLVSVSLMGSGDSFGVVWGASALLVCLAGLAVVVGRICVRRGDTWQAAVVAAIASFFGPLSAILLAFPSVRRSLRDVPSQWRARGNVEPPHGLDDTAAAPAEANARAEMGPLRHTPEQAAGAHRRGAALALGLAAAALAFSSSFVIGLWLVIVGNTLTDGNGVASSAGVAFLVGMIGFVAVLVAYRWRRVLAGVELAAAAGMVVAMIFVALDGGDLHWSDGNHLNVAFLYALWAIPAILFLWGAALARKPALG